MALRVVSLPAATSRMKNDAISDGVRLSPSTSAVTKAVVRSSCGSLLAGLGQLGDERGEVLGGAQQGAHDAGLGLVGDVLGVAEAEDHVGAVEDELLLAARDAHHVDDDPQRQGGGHVGDEVALAALDDLVDDLRRDRLDVTLHLVELAGREPPGDDPPHPGVLGVVHVDHRAEELEELRGHVGDVGARPGAEQRRALRRLDDVGVAGQRVVAGTRAGTSRRRSAPRRTGSGPPRGG